MHSQSKRDRQPCMRQRHEDGSTVDEENEVSEGSKDMLSCVNTVLVLRLCLGKLARRRG